MNDNTYNAVLPLLKDFVFVSGIGLFLLSMVIGILLVVNPELIIRLNTHVGKKFSFRKLTRVVEIPNDVDRIFYRHHRSIGALISVLSLYVLYYFIFVYDHALVGEFLKSTGNALIYDILISAARLLMLVCGGVIFLIGITIFFRPSQLKSIEAWANRWISTRQATRGLSVEHDQMNRLVYRYPRLIGLFIVFLSLYAGILLFLVYTR